MKLLHVLLLFFFGVGGARGGITLSKLVSGFTSVTLDYLVAELDQEILLLLGESFVLDDFWPLLHADQESQIIEDVFENGSRRLVLNRVIFGHKKHVDPLALRLLESAAANDRVGRSRVLLDIH